MMKVIRHLQKGIHLQEINAINSIMSGITGQNVAIPDPNQVIDGLLGQVGQQTGVNFSGENNPFGGMLSGLAPDFGNMSLGTMAATAALGPFGGLAAGALGSALGGKSDFGKGLADFAGKAVDAVGNFGKGLADTVGSIGKGIADAVSGKGKSSDTGKGKSADSGKSADAGKGSDAGKGGDKGGSDKS